MITGTEGNDILNGTSGDDTILGLGGDDALYGEGGNDTLNGGEGDDALFGGDGDDTFEASAGNDIVDGGDGFDTMRYAGSVRSFAIGVDNGALTLADFVGEEGGATLTNVEAVYFAAEDETFTLAELLDPSFTGTGANDAMLAGNTLDNRIYGLAGDDVLRGGAGYDLLDGGDGADTAYYAGSSSDFLIFRTVGGTVWIDDLAGGEHSDELVDIEALYFAGDDVTILVGDLPPLGTAAGETITGSARPDALIGLGGDDLLVGLLGDDGLEGGTGDDRYVYDPGDGDDGIWDESGFDAIEFGAGIDPADVIVTADGNSYVLTFEGAAGRILILNGVLEDYSVEEVRFDDETMWTAQDLYDRAFGESLMAPWSGGDGQSAGARAEIFGSQPYDYGMSCQIA
jgi:Ca2+-binding RTX toxin-like protein